MALSIQPLTLKEANALVEKLHRHHKPVVGHRFSIGVLNSCAGQPRQLVGCAVVGRPVARGCDPYTVAEVTRLVTDGTKNACSFLYSAAARICREMGFERIQTYILEDELGTSLVASGWKLDGWTQGGNWNGGKRQERREDQPMCRKQRWIKDLT